MSYIVMKTQPKQSCIFDWPIQCIACAANVGPSFNLILPQVMSLESVPVGAEDYKFAC